MWEVGGPHGGVRDGCLMACRLCIGWDPSDESDRVRARHKTTRTGLFLGTPSLRRNGGAIKMLRGVPLLERQCCVAWMELPSWPSRDVKRLAGWWGIVDGWSHEALCQMSQIPEVRLGA